MKAMPVEMLEQMLCFTNINMANKDTIRAYWEITQWWNAKIEENIEKMRYVLSRHLCPAPKIHLGYAFDSHTHIDTYEVL